MQQPIDQHAETFNHIGHVATVPQLKASIVAAINSDIDTINALIDQYNQASSREERLTILATIENTSQNLQDKYDARVYTVLTDFAIQIHQTLFLELRKQHENIDPGSRSCAFDSIDELVAKMSPEKIVHLMTLLSGPRLKAKNSSPPLEKLFNDLDNPLEKTAFEAFLRTHTLVSLGGGNATNFLVKRLRDDTYKVLKLEYRLHTPKRAERMLRQHMPDVITPVYAERQATFEHIHLAEKVTCGLLVTDYCPRDNLETFAKTIADDQQRLTSALTIYIEMANTFMTMQQSGCAFPDPKNTNWLLDEHNHLHLADTKSFITTVLLIGTSATEQRYIDPRINQMIETQYLLAPEMLATKPFLAEAMHVYLLGKNLYQFLTQCKLKDLSQSPNFQHNIFSSEQGLVLMALITQAVADDPAQRPQLAMVRTYLELISNLQQLSTPSEHLQLLQLLQDYPSLKNRYYQDHQASINNSIQSLENLLDIFSLLPSDSLQESILRVVLPNLPAQPVTVDMLPAITYLLTEAPQNSCEYLLSMLDLSTLQPHALIKMWQQLANHDKQDMCLQRIQPMLSASVHHIHDLWMLQQLPAEAFTLIMQHSPISLGEIISQGDIMANLNFLLLTFNDTLHPYLISAIPEQTLIDSIKTIFDLESILSSSSHDDMRRILDTIGPRLPTIIGQHGEAHIISGISQLFAMFPQEQHAELTKQMHLAQVITDREKLIRLLITGSITPHTFIPLLNALAPLIKTKQDFLQLLDAFPAATDMQYRRKIYQAFNEKHLPGFLPSIIQTAEDFCDIAARLPEKGVEALCKISALTLSQLSKTPADLALLRREIGNNLHFLARNDSDYMHLVHTIDEFADLEDACRDAFYLQKRSQFLELVNNMSSVLRLHQLLNAANQENLLDTVIAQSPNIIRSGNISQLRQLLANKNVTTVQKDRILTVVEQNLYEIIQNKESLDQLAPYLSPDMRARLANQILKNELAAIIDPKTSDPIPSQTPFERDDF